MLPRCDSTLLVGWLPESVVPPDVLIYLSSPAGYYEAGSLRPPQCEQDTEPQAACSPSFRCRMTALPQRRFRERILEKRMIPSLLMQTRGFSFHRTVDQFDRLRICIRDPSDNGILPAKAGEQATSVSHFLLFPALPGNRLVSRHLQRARHSLEEWCVPWQSLGPRRPGAAFSAITLIARQLRLPRQSRTVPYDVPLTEPSTLSNCRNDRNERRRDRVVRWLQCADAHSSDATRSSHWPKTGQPE